MLSKLKIALGSVVILACTNTFADTAKQPVNKASAATQEQKKEVTGAVDVKSVLMAKLDKLCFLTAVFSQQVIDPDGNLLQQASGALMLSKPNLVRWETTEPDESLIVSDSETLWFFDPFIEQVSAYQLQNAIANTPILLLTNQDQALWENYTVSQANKNSFLIHANDPNSQVKTLELVFEQDRLAGFVILDATGQVSKITLSQIDLANRPADKNFKFVVPEGIHLDDQR